MLNVQKFVMTVEIRPKLSGEGTTRSAVPLLRKPPLYPAGMGDSYARYVGRRS